MKTILLFIISVMLVTGISRSQTWDQKLNGRNVWSFAKDNQGNIFAGGLTGNNSRVWKSTNGGDSWDTVYFGSGQTMWDFAFDQQGTMYVAHYSTGLLKSTDGGTLFTLIPSSSFNNKNVQGVECGPEGNIYINTSTGFFRSTDNGLTFNETSLSGLNCLPLLVDIDSANIVYVGVTGSTNVGFYRSTDHGLTFSVNLNPGKNGYNLLQQPNGDVYMLTTTTPYNFGRTTNKGLSWTTVSNSPASQRGFTYSLAGNFYTSGNGGVFRSTNNGVSFTNFNFTTTATPILTVNYNSSLRIFAGTSGASAGGIWRCTEGPGPVININLKVLIEGMYNVPMNQMNRRDTVKLYLRDATAPYRLRDSAKSVIDSLIFTGLNTFYNAPSGTYYLVVRYINTIETWSKAGGEPVTADSTVYNFDFTASAGNAYGNNLKLINGNYCIYTGDPDQNGLVDLTDVISVYNDATVFSSGFVVTDLNGDGITDLSDIILAYNNSSDFVHKITP